MSIQITDSMIEQWIHSGIQQAVNNMLRDQYGTGANLKKAMDKAIAESEAQLVASLKVGIAQACVSPTFMKGIEQEIALSLSRQYRGAFDGVVRAAAKQAANNEIVAQRVAEIARLAAGIEK